MRFWITKNSEVPVREQLVRQVTLGILSEDLPPGHKLPSIRALARRHHIHSNTVSAAYHDLLDRGWLELRRGSGLYVRSLQAGGAGNGELDELLSGLLRAASARGYEPGEVLNRLEQLVLPRTYTYVVIVEPEPGMREILQSEVQEHLRIPVEAIDSTGFSGIAMAGTCLVAALATHAATLRQLLPRGVNCVTLRLRSVRASIEGQVAPGPNTMISVVSRSPEFRHWARAMLIAVGLDPERLYEIDTTFQDWQRRATAGAMAIADAVAARSLPAGCHARVFRVIADSSIAEMKQLCGK
jgi:DNA-binding transcriptional regulator YhcF (GntR family)